LSWRPPPISTRTSLWPLGCLAWPIWRRFRRGSARRKPTSGSSPRRRRSALRPTVISNGPSAASVVKRSGPSPGSRTRPSGPSWSGRTGRPVEAPAARDRAGIASFLMLPISVLLLAIGLLVSSQRAEAQRPQNTTASPPAAQAPQADELSQLVTEVLRTTREYRASLENLQAIYERDLAEATRRVQHLRAQVGEAPTPPCGAGGC
jgi:hypothetical protein